MRLVGAGDYESATNRPAEPESPINRAFQPSPTQATPVLATKFDQCSHPPLFTFPSSRDSFPLLAMCQFKGLLLEVRMAHRSKTASPEDVGHLPLLVARALAFQLNSVAFAYTAIQPTSVIYLRLIKRHIRFRLFRGFTMAIEFIHILGMVFLHFALAHYGKNLKTRNTSTKELF